MAKLFCIISFTLLLFCGFVEPLYVWDRLKRTAVLDRTVNIKSPGYYVQPIDITAFSVSQSIWLKQFDMPKIFLYDPDIEKPIDCVRVNFKIFEQPKSNSSEVKLIFFGNTMMSSKAETIVKLNIQLRSRYEYQIHVEMPKDLQLMYLNFLEIRQFQIKRFFRRSIFVDFYQRNKSIRPPAIKDDRRRNTQGIVKRIHLKKSWL